MDIEYSAFQMLTEGNTGLARQGVRLWLAGLNPQVLEYIRASGFPDALGPNALYHNAEAALQAYLADTNP